MKSEEPKVTVSIKSPQTAAGDSFIARYIAESNLNEEREGASPRLLFSADCDLLDWRQADARLSQGEGVPRKCDIIHMTVTLSAEDYLALGESEEDRMAHVRETTRATMNRLEVATEVSKLKWVAGIHRNTDLPHVHVAISRNAFDAEGAKPKRINKLPAELMGSTGAFESSTKIGLVAQAFAEGLSSQVASLGLS